MCKLVTGLLIKIGKLFLGQDMPFIAVTDFKKLTLFQIIK